MGETIRLLFPENGAISARFRITSCDKRTRELMEEFPELFPKSNVQAIANTMPARLAEMGVKINREFRHLDRQGRGYITLKQFRHQIANWAIELGFVDKSGLSEQELDELVRHYNENDDDKIEIGEFQEAFALSKKYVKELFF